ncbi:MAG TPA: hypothetical protein VN726_22250 [Hanamia sp.]|nr:hypothetical protein [Hanamia sp.]
MVFFNSCRRDASKSMELRGVSLDAVGQRPDGGGIPLIESPKDRNTDIG